ncbi:uncharacterized protein [Parasteatoda tepidariorum]|uniref:uncharacterized protein n=1 Tax=Parasteatoda tepidariorum TaxID=114398 RepID=UPI001C72970E|nr:uncharacterized protein LOC107453093 [Parasteatoda tepidariorum]XP_015925267.2 uncharacterized protein LOC107453093 [Parasteatoda tepidariorum]
MSCSHSLVNLPDLVLHHICTFLSCPFDLLHFGSTCSRIRKITLSESLWWPLAFQWFDGLWIMLHKASRRYNSRDWFLETIKYYSTRSSRTKQECLFLDGEKWERVDTKKARFLINLLDLVYSQDFDSPFVLYERYLYDIGMYTRMNPCLNFADDNLEISRNTILELADLSQAADRDLRRRKQPFKDYKYYIKRFGTSANWKTDLFPSNINGSICPLLLCPLRCTSISDASKVEALRLCLSIILGKHLRSCYTVSSMPLKDLPDAFHLFTSVFLSHLLSSSAPVALDSEGKVCLKKCSALLCKDLARFEELQYMFHAFGFNIRYENVLTDIGDFFTRLESLNHAVDQIRLKLRKEMMLEIEKVLFPNNERNDVTRVNLTDSDFIGGDNCQQEMSAAAFISNKGAFVTWHLIGRMRF